MLLKNVGSLTYVCVNDSTKICIVPIMNKNIVKAVVRCYRRSKKGTPKKRKTIFLAISRHVAIDSGHLIKEV